MKLQDITLNQIKDYFEECEYDGLITVELINNDEHGEVLELYRFDGEYDDDVFLCKIYRDRDGDFIVETETNLSPLNFGDGFIEEDDVSISEVVEILLTYAKSGICENIDFLKRQIEFINDFGKQCTLRISSVTIAIGNKYE